MRAPPRIADARAAAAPRRLEWTGERMLPWTDDPVIAYEHLHRYLFAAGFAEGRRVLDLGSGEGYGSALLSARAASVVGVDVAAEALEHARAAYPAGNLRFERASADDLSGFSDGEFDLVVCFEVIEHVEAQERVVAEARRVLAPEGLFLCSTPEREAYRARTGHVNEFHVRELDEAQFRELLAARFDHLALWSQAPVAGSLLEPLGGAARLPAETLHVGREDGYWDARDRPAPLYLVAVAGARALPGAGTSVLTDPDGLQRHLGSGVQRLEQALHRADERVREYRAAMEGREAEVRELVALADALRAEMLAAGDAAAERERELDAQVHELRRRLDRIENSPAWAVVQAGRRRLERSDGTPTAAGRAVGAAVRGAGRLARRSSPGSR